MVSCSGNSCPNVCARPLHTKRATSPLILTDTKVPGTAVHHRSVSCGSLYSSLGDAAGREPIPVRRAPPRRWEAVRHPALRGANKLRLSASECWAPHPACSGAPVGLRWQSKGPNSDCGQVPHTSSAVIFFCYAARPATSPRPPANSPLSHPVPRIHTRVYRN